MRFVAIIIALFATALASADGPALLATGSLALPTSPIAGGARVESHGWIIVPTSRGLSLVHVPPRGPAIDAGGAMFLTAPRSVHHAADLHEAPEAMAAWDRSVYLLFPPSIGGDEGGGRDRPRRVLTTSVFPAPLGAGWGAQGGERLSVLPPLEARGRLLGFAGTPQGPAALLVDRQTPLSDQAGPAAVRLLILVDGARWIEAAIPGEVIEAMRPGLSARADLGWVQLVSHAEGVSIFTRTPDAAGHWIARLDEATSESGEMSVEAAWRYAPLAADVGRPDSRVGPLFNLAGHLTYVRAHSTGGGEGTLSLRQITPERELRLAQIPGVTSQYGVVPLDANARVVVFVRVAERSDSAGSHAGAFTVHEVSAYTGRILDSGPANGGGPISHTQYRILAMSLVVITAIVMFLALRQERDGGEFTLPPGTALAPPLVRVMAGVIDTALALLLARWAVTIWFPAIEAQAVGQAWLMYFGLILAGGFVHCTIAEAIFGRSLGKAMLGCRVISIKDASALRGPSFVAAALRNLVRWTIPPLAWFFLTQPDLRHRGDRLARTAVIVQIESVGERPNGADEAESGTRE